MKKTLFAALTLLAVASSAPALDFTFDGKTNGAFSFTGAPAVPPAGIALYKAP